MSTTSSKRDKWPKVRQVTHKSGTPAWMVDARINGKGERFFYATATEADTKADLLRVARKNTGNEGAAMPARLRADAMDAEKRLAAVGATLMDAVEYYLLHARPSGGVRTVKELVAEFLLAKRVAGRKESYISIQGYVLGNVFGGQFGERPVHEITPTEIEDWMNGRKWTLQTRKNYFQDVRNLFGFAIRRGYRPTNPMARLEKPIVTAKSPGVLTVEQAAALLTAANDGDGAMLPAVALGLFAGLRTAELELLEWKHVSIGEKNIHVPPEIAKTREGRDVPMNDTLLAWIRPYARHAGRIGPAKSFDYHLAQTAKAAGIEDWPKNAMRHSFASYHFARHGNAPLTASMLGHKGSTTTLFAKYQKRVKPADAKRFWKLKPAGKRTVIPFTQAA